MLFIMPKMMLNSALLLLLAWSTGCGQSDIKVYRVAKADASPAPPSLKWTLPAGWEEVSPGEMRVASFRIKGPEGKQADVSIVPLPGTAGGVSANVNRWRGQLGLSPLTEEDLSRTAQPVEIAGMPAKLYEQAGKISASGDPARILGAIQDRAGTAW